VGVDVICRCDFFGEKRVRCDAFAIPAFNDWDIGA